MREPHGRVAGGELRPLAAKQREQADDVDAPGVDDNADDDVDDADDAAGDDDDDDADAAKNAV